MKKLILKLCVLVGIIGLAACSSNIPKGNTITVATIAGPETQLMDVAAKVAMQRYHLKVDVVPFSDYNAPNEALATGSVDANAFQHKPFLDAQIKERNYKLTAIGKTFIYPMAFYSHKIKNIRQLPVGAKVALPNDPTNEARALLLLQHADLIKLRAGVGVNATPEDIISNPKRLNFVELDAAQTPRSLDDVTIAAINTTFAIPAKLSPIKDAILRESTDSPYANLIVVRTADVKKKRLQELVKAFQSEAVIKKARELFGDGAIPAWK